MKIRKTFVVSLVVAAGVTIGGLAIAQQHGGHGMQGGSPGMKGMMMKGGHGQSHGAGHTAAKGDQSAASLAFQAVNEKMHRDMAIEFSGDADADFARAMIPHHQGAIDMAKLVIAFGKDEEIRKLAKEIVQAQETEIAFMHDWLKKKTK